MHADFSKPDGQNQRNGHPSERQPVGFQFIQRSGNADRAAVWMSALNFCGRKDGRYLPHDKSGLAVSNR